MAAVFGVLYGVFVLIEVFIRLGLALLLSMGMALLMAWGWDSSDRAASGTQELVSAASTQDATAAPKPPARSTE